MCGFPRAVSNWRHLSVVTTCNNMSWCRHMSGISCRKHLSKRRPQTEATNWVPTWKHCKLLPLGAFLNLKHLKQLQLLGRFRNFQIVYCRFWLFYLWTQSPKFFKRFYFQNRHYSICLLRFDSFWGHRCPSLAVPSHVRQFQRCRSLPMWKLSPRSRRVMWTMEKCI